MWRSRPSLGLLVGILLPLVLVAPGCLKSLDESLMNKDSGAGAAAGSAGDASAGSGGQTDGGGSGGIDGGAGADGSPDAIVDARPEAGFTPYNKNQHPVTNLLGTSARRLIAVDNSTVFATNLDEPKATLTSVPLDFSSGATSVTTDTLSRPQALIAPSNSLSVYYLGATATDNGVIGVFLKNTGGGNPATQISIGNSFGRAVGIVANSDNNAYVSVRATALSAPALLKFSLAAGTTSGQVVLVSQTSSETGGPVTATKSCIYWISNGSVWTVKKDGSSASPLPALGKQVTDAVDISSDANNIYYTRGNGEVWQRPLGTACDNSGTGEQVIAWGYANIGHVGVYGSTVVWSAQGTGSSYNGGGIFTTDVGGYDVVQIAPPDQGVDDMAVGPSEIVYSTLDGVVHKVPK